MEYSDLHLHLTGSLSLDDIKILSWLDSEAEIDIPYYDEEIAKLVNMEYAQKDSLLIRGMNCYHKCFLLE